MPVEIPSTQRAEHRPWGHFITLTEGPGFKVKRLVILPGKRISLQRHQHRAEHWLVVSMTPALVTVGERTVERTIQQSVWILKGEIHRIENQGEDSVIVIETQFGPLLDEGDIERIEDDFGRIE